MMYGLYSLIKSGDIAAGSRVLAIHTGGTQTAALRHLPKVQQTGSGNDIG